MELKLDPNAKRRYIINLDLPPTERWNQVIDDYADHIKQVDKIITDHIHEELGKLGNIFVNGVEKVFGALTKYGVVYAGEELNVLFSFFSFFHFFKK